MNIRFIAAVFAVFLACVLQFWFASLGIAVNLILAALIALAFLFGIWEVVFFTVLALFIINWQPAFGEEIVLFGVLPLAAYASHRLFSWEAWAGSLVAIAAGLVITYGALEPEIFFARPGAFLLDLIGSLLFGAAVFAVLNRRGR